MLSSASRTSGVSRGSTTTAPPAAASGSRRRSGGADSVVSTSGGTAVSVNSRLSGSRSADPVTTAIGGGVGASAGRPPGAAVVLRADRARAHQHHLGQLAQQAEHRLVGVGPQTAGGSRRGPPRHPHWTRSWPGAYGAAAGSSGQA